MANATNLPGIIGQVYEDRRNGDSGKLISRDEKCKTLTFQSDDGNSFVKSYSHFRSYMRKKADVPEEEIKEEAYAEAELTSIEVSDADAEKMEKNAKRKQKTAEKVEEAKTRKQKESMSEEDVSNYFNSMVDVVKDFVESFNSPLISYKSRDYKKACVFKVCGKSLMILYARPSRSTVYITSVPQFITEVKHSVDLQEIKHHSAKTVSQRSESYIVSISDLKANLEDLREAIIEIVSYKEEKESEE